MKTTKPKPVFALIQNEDSLAAAANEYVTLKLELKKREVAHEKRIAEANTEFERENAEAIRRLASLEASAQLYCETNKELFEGARSRDYRNARVGFRTNPPRVEKLLSKDTFDAIAERTAELPWGEPFVKYGKITLDKDALLKHRADLTETQLRQAGIRFEQGETFYIEPAFDSVEGVRKEAEAA